MGCMTWGGSEDSRHSAWTRSGRRLFLYVTRSLTASSMQLNRKVLYGTAAGELGEIDLETGADINSVTLTEPDPLAPNAPIGNKVAFRSNRYFISPSVTAL